MLRAGLIAALLGVAALGGIMVRTWQRPHAAPVNAEYDDHIRLPIEAFGANWRIQVFRRGKPFPSYVDIAFERAMAAINTLNIKDVRGEPAEIAFAPRLYTIHRPLRAYGEHVLIAGALLDASKVDYAIIIQTAPKDTP
jgi:hypothetical protein